MAQRQDAVHGGENVTLGHLQVDNFRLHLLGPVHIGDGRRVTGYEYLYDPRARTIGVLDMGKFFDYIVARRLVDSYEQYLSAPMGKKLYVWLQENAVSPAQQRDLILYSLPVQDDVRPNDLHFFVKDAEGRPYIPGSSVKGALRTALAHAWLADGRIANPERFVNLQGRKMAARA